MPNDDKQGKQFDGKRSKFNLAKELLAKVCDWLDILIFWRG
jgi:hypothetical protein